MSSEERPQTHRESADHYFLRLARVTSSRGTCPRRQVGCILVDSHRRVLATGYNGVPRGLPHCSHGSQDCGGAACISGTGLDECIATHAEANALLQCSDVERIHTCYSTTSPCIQCVKLLLNTSCTRILFIDEYPHPKAKELWLSAPGKREWLKETI